MFNPLQHLPRPKLTGANLLNAGGAVVILYLLVVLGSTIKHNYDLGQQVSQLKGQITNLQSQKTALANTIQYEHTNSFNDREARSQLGLQQPGEKVIVIPESTPAPTPLATAATAAKPKASNFQQWLTFLSGNDAAH